MPSNERTQSPGPDDTEAPESEPPTEEVCGAHVLLDTTGYVCNVPPHDPNQFPHVAIGLDRTIVAAWFEGSDKVLTYWGQENRR